MCLEKNRIVQISSSLLYYLAEFSAEWQHRSSPLYLSLSSPPPLLLRVPEGVCLLRGSNTGAGQEHFKLKKERLFVVNENLHM
jgi:hypothetical protein